MALSWKQIKSEDDYGHGSRTTATLCLRAKVPGGWLIRVESLVNDRFYCSIAFYPDPEHRWDGTSPE